MKHDILDLGCPTLSEIRLHSRVWRGNQHIRDQNIQQNEIMYKHRQISNRFEKRAGEPPHDALLGHEM